MSNELHDDVTRYTQAQRVAAPASASAFASKEPLTRLEQRLARADWDYLCEERVAIMVESGISEGRASALAVHVTTISHGHRPQVSL